MKFGKFTFIYTVDEERSDNMPIYRPKQLYELIGEDEKRGVVYIREITSGKDEKTYEVYKTVFERDYEKVEVNEPDGSDNEIPDG